MIFSRRNTPPGFYVYFYLRKDGTPYYCGKGYGTRAWDTHHFRIPKDTSRIFIAVWGLTELWSLALERRFIRWYGRKDIDNSLLIDPAPQGILRNQTDGGEGTAGWVPSDINKSNISQATQGNGKNSIWWNNGVIEKKCVKYPGSDWSKGRLRLLNIGYANVGKLWWNNGVCEKMSYCSPGNNWVQGKLISHNLSGAISARSKGKTWYNNGIKNKRSFEKPGHEWQPGFIKFNTTAR
jgi:hypothetical protein